MPWWGWLLLGVWVVGQLVSFREIVRVNLWKWQNYMFEAVIAGTLFSFVWPVSLPVVYFQVHPSEAGIGRWCRKHLFQGYEGGGFYINSRYRDD